MIVSNAKEMFYKISKKTDQLSSACLKFYKLFESFLKIQPDEKATMAINDFIAFLKKQPGDKKLDKEFEQCFNNPAYKNSPFIKYLKAWEMVERVVLYERSDVKKEQLTFPDGAILKYKNLKSNNLNGVLPNLNEQVLFLIIDKDGKVKTYKSESNTGILSSDCCLNLVIFEMRKFAYIVEKGFFIFNGVDLKLIDEVQYRERIKSRSDIRDSYTLPEPKFSFHKLISIGAQGFAYIRVPDLNFYEDKEEESKIIIYDASIGQRTEVDASQFKDKKKWHQTFSKLGRIKFTLLKFFDNSQDIYCAYYYFLGGCTKHFIAVLDRSGRLKRKWEIAGPVNDFIYHFSGHYLLVIYSSVSNNSTLEWINLHANGRDDVFIPWEFSNLEWINLRANLEWINLHANCADKMFSRWRWVFSTIQQPVYFKPDISDIYTYEQLKEVFNILCQSNNSSFSVVIIQMVIDYLQLYFNPTNRFSNSQGNSSTIIQNRLQKKANIALDALMAPSVVVGDHNQPKDSKGDQVTPSTTKPDAIPMTSIGDPHTGRSKTYKAFEDFSRPKKFFGSPSSKPSLPLSAFPDRSSPLAPRKNHGQNQNVELTIPQANAGGDKAIEMQLLSIYFSKST